MLLSFEALPLYALPPKYIVQNIKSILKDHGVHPDRCFPLLKSRLIWNTWMMVWKQLLIRRLDASISLYWLCTQKRKMKQISTLLNDSWGISLNRQSVVLKRLSVFCWLVVGIHDSCLQSIGKKRSCYEFFLYKVYGLHFVLLRSSTFPQQISLNLRII